MIESVYFKRNKIADKSCEASSKSLKIRGYWRLFSFFMLLTSAIVLCTCKNEDDKPVEKVPTPNQIALNQGLGDQIDFAVLGKNGIGYFYEYQDNKPNIPQRLSVYDRNKNNVDLVIEFDDKGLPKNILSKDFTIVLGNYSGNSFDAVVITKDGESQLIENIETKLNWNEYLTAIGSGSSSIQRAFLGNFIKDVGNVINDAGRVVGNAISDVGKGVEQLLQTQLVSTTVSVVGCGVSVFTAALPLAAISCASAINDVGGALGLWEASQVVSDLGFLGDFINLANCGSNYISCASSMAGLVTYGANNLSSSAQSNVRIGEGVLLAGSGNVQITLTWDNYADIDLHCIDPAGFQIYFANPYSSYTGGYLDYDNTVGFGPENIFFTNAPNGTYRVFIHYYAANYGITSVNFAVSIIQNGTGKVYYGTISGVGSYVEIDTFTLSSSSRSSNLKSSNEETIIEWHNLPQK